MKIKIELVEQWWTVFIKSWSARLASLSFFFGIIEIITQSIHVLNDSPVFLYMSTGAAALSAYARIVNQTGLDKAVEQKKVEDARKQPEPPTDKPEDDRLQR